MFSAAIFDMDGLLIDSERGIMQTWLDVSAEHGAALAPADYLRTIGHTYSEACIILRDLLGSQALFEAMRSDVDGRLNDPVREPFPLKPGALEVLEALRSAGVRCAVASSSGVRHVADRLAAVGVAGHFETLAGGDEVARGKPDPAVYLLAARRLGVEAQQCLAFEDSENGTRAAMAAGIQVVVVPDLKPPTGKLLAQTFRTLPRLGDALEHLPQWFAAAHRT